MKKIFTLIALGALMAVQSVQAQEVVTYVTNKSEFTNAFNAHPGTPGSVTKIILAGQKDEEGNYPVANRELFNIGNFTPDAQANADGTIIITSEQTDMEKQPIFYGALNMSTQQADSHFSLVFENVQIEYRAGNLASSGQVVYWNKADCHADSIIFRNCNITNIPRTLIRTVPVQEDGVYHSDNTLNRFVMEGCRVFDMDVISGNSWPIVYLATQTAEVTFRNNMFYNIPFSKQILTWNYCEPTGTDNVITFENNLVVASKGTWKGYDGTEAAGPFDLISVGSYLGTMATYEINNNIILTPEVGVEYTSYGNRDQKGSITLVEATESKILACTGGMVFASNNVVEGYASWSAGNNKDEEGNRTWILGPAGSEAQSEDATEGRYEMTTVDLNWSDFYDAHGADYRLLKSHPLYAQNIGPAMMYVDEFPVRATVNVNIEGSNSVDYAITPVKEHYNLGDEVTITLNDHNTPYMELNTFLGWDDGSMDNPRVIKIEGDVDITAYYEAVPVLSAFDFSTAPAEGNNRLLKYAADIYADEDHRAEANVCILNEDSGVYSAVDGNENRFNWRSGKFGEDSPAEQMCVLSRKTPATAREAGKPDYLQFTVSTKDMSNVSFSAYCGTDNFGYKTQIAEYSLDGENWTEFARVDLESRDAAFSIGDGKLWGWTKLAGVLPAELENQDKVYIRVIGDVEGELVDNVISEIDHTSAGMFEYVGSVLFTAEVNTDGIFEVTRNNNVTATIYNLMGMKVGAQQKGLLIQNGKKHIVK